MSNLNVAVLVGNGFDLKAGLDTSPMSFIESFVERYGSDDPDLWDKPAARLCQKIQEDGIESWCDFERKVGEYSPAVVTIEDGTAKGSDYVAAKAALDEHLREYMMAQNELVDDAFISANAKTCDNSLADWVAVLTDRDRDSFLQGLSWPAELNYNVLCFNYTSTLERLLTPGLGHPLKPDRAVDGSIIHKLNSFSYVHGTIAGAPVCGVDNPTQIRDETLRASPKVIGTTVKPSIQSLMGSNQDRDAISKLVNANVVLIFGMSLGMTDQRWWRIVCDSLQKSPSRRVVICVRGLAEKKHIPASYYATLNYWRSLLIEAAGLDGADYPVEARNRILLVPAEPILQIDQPVSI